MTSPDVGTMSTIVLIVRARGLFRLKRLEKE